MGLGKASQALASQTNKLSSIRVQASTLGLAIPLLFGTTRITVKLIGEWDWTATAVKTGGKKGGKGGKANGGGGNTIYKYSASIEGLLCAGPIRGIARIWDTNGKLLAVKETYSTTVPGGGGNVTITPPSSGAYYADVGVGKIESYSVSKDDYGDPNGSQTITGNQNVPLTPVSTTPTTGEYKVNTETGVYTFAAGNGGDQIEIVYVYIPQNSSGNNSPVTTLALTIILGDIGQAAWSYLVSKHPTEALGYSGMALLAAANADLGESGTLPNLSYEVMGQLIYDGGHQDALPRDIAVYLLSEPVQGLGSSWNSDWIGDLTQWANFCLANGFFFSPAYESQSTLAELIQALCDMTNTAPMWSEGLLKFRPYGDTTIVGNGAVYSPETTPIYDINDDSYLATDRDPIEVSRTSYSDSDNSISLEFLNRDNSYNVEIAESKDLTTIQQFGLRKRDPIVFHPCTQGTVAKLITDFMLKRSIFIRRRFKFTVGFQYPLLECMDLATVTDPDQGLNLEPVRITRIIENENGEFEIEAEEFPWGTAQPTLYQHQDSAGYNPDGYADPGMVNTPLIFEANDRISLQGGQELWMAVSGASSNWGGCTIHLSADGSDYKVVGRIQGPATMGELTATLPSHVDPDTTNTLSVDLTESFGELQPGSTDDCDNFRTLCFVDGELISYEDATLTSAYNYDLGTRLRRGVYGSSISSHSSGSKFVRLNNGVFVLVIDPQWIGKTIHLKFTSFNRAQNAEQDISVVTDYTHTVVGHFGNYSRIVANDGTVDSVGDGAGPTYTTCTVRAYGKVTGTPTPGTDVTFTRDDQTTFTGPYINVNGQALTTTFYAMLNPSDDSTYLISDTNPAVSYAAMMEALTWGHVCIGSTLSVNSGGTGGQSGGGGGGSGGGCPWVGMLDDLGRRLYEVRAGDTFDCLTGIGLERGVEKVALIGMMIKVNIRCVRIKVGLEAVWVGSWDTRFEQPDGSLVIADEMNGKLIAIDTGPGTVVEWCEAVVEEVGRRDVIANNLGGRMYATRLPGSPYRAYSHNNKPAPEL